MLKLIPVTSTDAFNDWRDGIRREIARAARPQSELRKARERARLIAWKNRLKTMITSGGSSA